MSVICEECGKLYHIPPEKLENLKGKTAKLKCKVCGHLITVTKPEEGAESMLQTPDDGSPAIRDTPDNSDTNRDASPEKGYPAADKKDSSKMSLPTTSGFKTKGLGLRSKMFFLFLLIPLALMTASGYFSLNQLKVLSSEIIDESTKVVQLLAEEKIANKARSVALQCRIFLLSHPDIDKEDFNYDMDFKRIAVQKVGLTGYTALIEKGAEKSDWRIWAHVNPRIVGVDIAKELKREQETNIDRFFNLLLSAAEGHESKGYYQWKGIDKRQKEMYMAVTPIEGSPYLILSTTSIDEFTGQIKKLENNAAHLTKHTRTITLGILIGTIVIIGLSISIYGYRLTNNIKYLTIAADRISVGELDAEIVLHSKDEIGNLAEAISRMQDSLRFSIERLRAR